MRHPVRALFFDVFGTVVDWRRSVIADLAGFFEPRGITRDWDRFALDWRALYQPAMEAVRRGDRDFVILDILHRENLVTLLERDDIGGLSAAEIDHLSRVWHRLDPWPDAVPGLTRLRQDRIVAALSNGNIALMVNMARRGGLEWDAILGAEIARNYKPDPSVYLNAASVLALAPEACMMVAAHNDDLRAAQALGFRTAFIARPDEYGPGQSRDLAPEGDWDIVTDGLTGLADRLAEHDLA